MNYKLPRKINIDDYQWRLQPPNTSWRILDILGLPDLGRIWHAFDPHQTGYVQRGLRHSPILIYKLSREVVVMMETATDKVTWYLNGYRSTAEVSRWAYRHQFDKPERAVRYFRRRGRYAKR